MYWLKENAEFLSVCVATGTPLADPEVYAAIYADLPRRMAFFPQYYRFWLSICLDLEALGLPGDQSGAMAQRVQRSDLVAAELSDLQRGEAAWLLSRRGITLPDPGLEDRLRAFAARPATFGLPNRKAAYELTHIVFYLSAYGRRDPHLTRGALRSLDFAGLQAFLAQDIDLLAEICVALRFAGQTPSPIWEGAVLEGLRAVRIVPGAGAEDDYHLYLMCQWLACAAAPDLRAAPLPDAPFAFAAPQPRPSALRDLSRALMDMEGRSADWDRMRPRVLPHLRQPDVLAEAEASSPHFAPFFEVFARAALH
ncbi:MAG: hypothetical protein AAGF60_01360 [Pseudomonadota bacterium]